MPFITSAAAPACSNHAIHSHECHCGLAVLPPINLPPSLPYLPFPLHWLSLPSNVNPQQSSVSSTMSGLTQTLPGHPPLFWLPLQHRLYITNEGDEAKELEGRHRTSPAPPSPADNWSTWLFHPHWLLYNQSQHASDITDRSPSSVIPPQPWQPCRPPTPAPPHECSSC